MFKAGNDLRRVLICVAVASGLALVACTPAEKVALTGRVRLEQVGKTESDFLFALENGSSQPIRFEGWSRLLSDSSPAAGSYSSWCYSTQSSRGATVGPAFADGGSAPKRIEVPSGERLRISVPKSGFRLYEGSRCRLRLTLEGGAAVESAEFNP